MEPLHRIACLTNILRILGLDPGFGVLSWNHRLKEPKGHATGEIVFSSLQSVVRVGLIIALPVANLFGPGDPSSAEYQE